MHSELTALEVAGKFNPIAIADEAEMRNEDQYFNKEKECVMLSRIVGIYPDSEAGRYGDSAGDRELAADIQLLATERVNSSTTADTYEIDPITETLPQMRGYGYVDNSFKAYNLDSKIQRKAA